jgi:L-asparaginase / beta-aspartyl-peptidase
LRNISLPCSMFRLKTGNAFRSALAAALFFFSSPSNADERAEIEAMLMKQAAAWNRGDIESFMEHYWKSDQLTFSSGGETTRGWQSTKERYLRRYPSREQMGQLKFTQLEITTLGDSAALVLGRWHLMRDLSPLEGNFTLVLRRIDGSWVIIHDHTSKAEAK